MNTSYGVCFDLHHTLVDYEGHLRPGTKELFEKLQKDHISIILTTTGGGQHLQDVSRDMGIKNYLASVFEGPQIDMGNGKRYAPAAATLGLSRVEAPHRLIATGDLLSDQPADIPIVFIHHPGGYKYDASLLGHLIQHLLQEGGNSFIDGFDRIMKDHSAIASLDGISVRLSYEDPRESGKDLPLFAPGIRIPIMRVISAEKYMVSIK